MIKDTQKPLYWRFWSEVCAEHGWSNSDTERRRALHAQAGCPASMTAFSNTDLDRYLSFCRQLLGTRECTEVAAQEGARKRLLWRIATDARTAKLDDSYLNKISTDQFGLACWRDLCLADLTHIRNVLHNRAGRHVGHDTRTLQKRPTRKYTLTPPAPRTTIPQELLPF